MSGRRLSWLSAVLVAAVLGAGSGKAEPWGRSTHGARAQLEALFPGTTGEMPLSLLRVDDCRVTVVHATKKSAPLIIVQGSKRDRTMATAERLLQVLDIKDGKIVPFAKQPWVVITCPFRGQMPEDSPLRALYAHEKWPKQFTDLKNGILTARVDYQYLNANSRPVKCQVDISVDLTGAHRGHVEFRVVKGRLDERQIKDFICDRLAYETSSANTELTRAERAKLRKSYNGGEVLMREQNSSHDFCIVFKNKSYHAGPVQSVRDAMTSKPAFHADFPAANMPWPQEGEPAEDTPPNQPPPAEPPPATPEPPQQPPQQPEPTPKPAEDARMSPSQALEAYLNILKSL